MAKPWGGMGGIGAWAADAERAEAEELEQQASAPPPSSQFAAPGGETFPSLKDSIAAKPKKKKQTMTLSEFTTGTYVGPGGARRGGGDHSSSDSKGLTTEEMLRLPTGPKERSAEEMDYNRLGGGFRSYGTGGGSSRGGGGNRDGGGRRSYGGFDDDRRAPPPRVSDMDQPSRADGVDNWAVGKKSFPSSMVDSGRQDRGDRYSSLGSGSGSGGGGGGGSRADDVDNWAVGKKPMPPPTRSTNFGSGFKDSSADGDRWSRGGGMGGGMGMRSDGDRGGERPRLVLNPPRGDIVPNEPVKTSKASPFGAARPREEVLAEKGLDWRQQDSEIETRKTSRPTSSHSSRPGSAHSARPESPNPQIIEAIQKPRPKVNPFGDAKPREVQLQAQGKDWKKMDLELERRGIDRPESEEEKLLKEEIDHLKKELENEATADANGESLEVSGEPKANLNELILSRERDLELLTRELDDKVRFSQKATERPGSGTGRFTFSDRPPPPSDLAEESRSMEFRDRPRSRGNEAWARPGDDRRAFQSGRERGFPGNTDIDRSRSSGRW